MLPLLSFFAAVSFTGGLTDSQVLQRDATGRATPVVLGTTDTPGRLQARVGDGAWTEVATLAAGAWEARLSALATGGPHRVAVRVLDATGATAAERSFRDVYVGDLWILAGQSNMVGRARIEEPYARDPRVRLFTLQGAWRLATHPLHEEPLPPGVTRPGHGPGLEFAGALVAATGVPIGLIACAKGGTSMDQWSPDAGGTGRNALYANLLAQVKLAGGRVAGVLWYQGENDSGPEPSAVYQRKFLHLVARLRSDLGRPDLPFLYAQLGRLANEVQRFYSEWSVIREAQRTAEALIPAPARLVATVDLDNGDYIHLSRESQDRLGRRFAHAALGKGGPRFVDARWSSPNELRVRLSGVNGELRAPGGRIFGFEATSANGQRRLLFFRTTWDAAAGEIVLHANRDSAKRTAPEEIDLWYGRGHDPICNLTDALDLALPAFGPIRLPPRPAVPPAAKK
jgi:sialate O-acetylesterase